VELKLSPGNIVGVLEKREFFKEFNNVDRAFCRGKGINTIKGK